MKKLSLVLICVLVLTMGLFAEEKKNEDVFHVCYYIGIEATGSTVFRVNLVVHTDDREIVGYGKIQGLMPPVNIPVELDGHYTLMGWEKKFFNVVHLTGYQGLYQKKGSPLKVERVQLFMVLSEDWQSGTASYLYMDNDGKWKEVRNVPVKRIQCRTEK